MRGNGRKRIAALSQPCLRDAYPEFISEMWVSRARPNRSGLARKKRFGNQGSKVVQGRAPHAAFFITTNDYRLCFVAALQRSACRVPDLIQSCSLVPLHAHFLHLPRARSSLSPMF